MLQAVRGVGGDSWEGSSSSGVDRAGMGWNFPPGCEGAVDGEAVVGKESSPGGLGKGKEHKTRNSGNVLLLTVMETFPQNSPQIPANTRLEGALRCHLAL